MTTFPSKRLRRLRVSENIRNLVQEVRLSTNDLVCPIFVEEGLKEKKSVDSMPDIMRLPLSEVSNEVQNISDLKIPAVMVFGIPSQKDEQGTSAFADNGIVQQAISEIKNNFGDKISIMADVCLCQYTSSGHCGIINDKKIDNDLSIETLTKIAVSQAKVGVDVVSPSAMMDGQVSAIRKGLDDADFKFFAAPLAPRPILSLKTILYIKFDHIRQLFSKFRHFRNFFTKMTHFQKIF